MIAFQEQLGARVRRGEVRVENYSPEDIEIHPERRRFPKCNPWSQEQINRSIEEHGFFAGTALIAHRDSGKPQLLDGWARLDAAIKAGLQVVPVAIDNCLEPFAVIVASAIASHTHSKSRAALLLAEHYGLLNGSEERQRSGLRNQSSGEPVITANKIAGDFNIPAQYFANLAKVKASLKPEQWDRARRDILDGEASLGSVQGLLGRVTSVMADGKRRSSATENQLLFQFWDLGKHRMKALGKLSSVDRIEDAKLAAAVLAGNPLDWRKAFVEELTAAGPLDFQKALIQHLQRNIAAEESAGSPSKRKK